MDKTKTEIYKIVRELLSEKINEPIHNGKDLIEKVSNINTILKAELAQLEAKHKLELLEKENELLMKFINLNINK